MLLTLADAYDGRPPTPTTSSPPGSSPTPPVLQRAAAVICHGGMGIVGKATSRGVPIVSVPFGRDQPEVARRVSEAGTGVRFPATKLTGPPGLRQAVQQAFKHGPRARAVAARLERTDPAEAFAGAVGRVLERATVDA